MIGAAIRVGVVLSGKLPLLVDDTEFPALPELADVDAALPRESEKKSAPTAIASARAK